MVFSAIPQVITEDRASGAQFIDGSLKFDGGYLTRTPTSVGNRKTFTWSAWIKRSDLSSRSAIWGAGTTNGSNNPGGSMYFNSSSGTLQVVNGGGTVFSHVTSASHRDTGWYHVVIAINTAGTPRVAIYINGEQATASGTIASQNFELDYNNTIIHAIGSRTDDGSLPTSIFNGHMSQVYLIDGQALGPEEFGYTDALTNTWRPKKYNVSKADTVLVGSPTYASSDFKTEGNKTSDQTSLSFGSWTSGSYTGAETKIFKNSTDTAFKLNVSLVGGTTDRLLWYSDNLTDWTFVGNTNPSRNYQLSGHKYYATSEGSGSTTLHATADGYNTFYLPMDGNSPVGKDQSGNGNDWTPVNFGGSVELSKATGAIPILNTNDAGTVAKKGVRTDSKTYTVTASGGNYYIDGALKPTLNAYRGGSYTFDYTGATSHPFYLSSLPDGKHNSKAYSVLFDGSGDYLSVPSSSDFDFGSGDCTVECFVYITSHAGDKTVIGSWEGTTSWQLSYGADSGNDRFAFMMHDGSSTLAAISSIQSTNYVNQWVHLAGVRHGNWLRVYVNGVFGGERSISGAHTTFNAPLTIGGRSNGNQVTGYVSNVRVVKGTALYTAAFVPPSTTLTNVTGTTLLCCQESNAATAAVIPFGSITVSGNVATSQTRQPFLYDNNHGNFGVNTATSNTTKITIPHLAADTLYYYCNAHSGMGSSINVTTDVLKADPYAWKNVLAMPLVGSSADVSGDLNVNSSTKAVTVTNVTSTNSSHFYGGSFDFSGNPTAGQSTATDYLTISSSSDFGWGTGDYTIEMWIYSPTYNGGTGNNDVVPFSHVANTGLIYLNWSSGSYGQFKWYNGSSVYTPSPVYELPPGKWVHLVVCRSGATTRLFSNGILRHSFSDGVNYGTSSIILGKGSGNNLNAFYGQMSDVRVYNGVAKYTENFIPASTNPDVLPDTPSGITGKINLAKITEGAVSFDGSGDYLGTYSSSSDFTFGTGDFTVEMMLYNRENAGKGFIQFSDTAGGLKATNSGVITIHKDASSHVFRAYAKNASTAFSTTVPYKRWCHVALVRESGTIKLFVDGKQDATTISSDTTNYATTYVAIGGYYDTNYLSDCTISNVRVNKGTALYTSDFTPPTRELTNVTNTKLLCCQSTTSAVAAAVAPGSITANGNAAATNFNPFTDDINTIRGQETGYATLNPLSKHSDIILSNGNLTFTNASSAGWRSGGSIGHGRPSSGKYYFETQLTTALAASGYNHFVGVLIQDNYELIGGDFGNNANGYLVGTYTGSFRTRNNGSYGPSVTKTSSTGAILQVAIDVDNGKLWFGCDNVWASGSPHSNTNPSYTFTAGTPFSPHFATYGANASMDANFGQKPFKFPPPDGFQPLSLSNLQPEKVIARPDQYVSATLFTGTGDAVSSRTVELSTAADLVWAKSRDRSSSYQIADTVRGNNSVLQSNANMTARNPTTQYSGGGVSTIDGKTITIASGTTNNQNLNVDGNRGVIWSWKAGGNKNTFNIDDVGYANASDVNMSVGSLNSSAYDTSDVWSDDLSSAQGAYGGSSVANAFDGSLTVGFEAGNPSGNYSTIRFQPASAITVNSRLRIHVFDLNDASVAYQYRVNDGSWTSFPGTSSPYRIWRDLNFTGTLNSFEYRSSTNSTYKPTLYAVEIDGKMLIDSGTDLSGLTQYPSIAPTGCSVGTKQGFSIIKYDGAGTSTSATPSTIPHGLSQAPSFFMVKGVSGTNANDDWFCYHKDLGSNRRIRLNLNNAADPQANLWGNETAPTSSVISINKGWYSVNYTGHTHIIYAWHDVPGLQKFGSYKNPSSSEGAFVELGFKPAILMYKCALNISSSSGAGDWMIIDTTRSPVNNPSDMNNLSLNVNNTEDGYYAASQGAVDILSNGFKIRHPNSSPGGDPGRLYIYAAWAEAPTVNLYGGQANAR